MPQRKLRKPVFAALSTDECWALLGRNHVGRLAFVNQGVVDIEPVHYVAALDAWLFVRSAEGTKMEAFAHRPFVAFEVDEIDAMFDWRSVVAHGTVYLMSERALHVDRLAFERALRALRSFFPATMTKDDPTPFRRRVYGIHVDRVTGRVAEQRGPVSGRRPLKAPPSTPRRRRVSDGS
jgi:nitroimidazol reductase NimA-like FMN-containing flavoprotein (pyridoxamine 5'-phosphate oxidase superfamily)